MNAIEDSKKKNRAWWWGLLALLILVLACLWVNGQRIPRDISQRVTGAVGAWGVPAGLAIGVDGRDVVLSGAIDPAVDREGLVKMVQSLRGVRTVSDHLTPAALEPARFGLEFSGGQAVFTGLLPDPEDLEALEKTAATLVDKGKITRRVETRPGVAAPAWLPALTALIPELKGAITAGVEAGPAGLILTGTVPTEAELERIGTKAEAFFAGVLSVDNRLQVTPPMRPARLTLSLDAGAIALSGELPGQAEIHRVLTAARSAFTGAKITDTLTVGDTVAQPAWLEAVLELMPELAPVAQAGLRAGSDDITLSGTVSSAEIRGRIEKKAKAVLGEMVLVNRIEVAKQAIPVETPAPAPPAPLAPAPPVAPAPAPPAAPPPEVNSPTLYFQHDSIALTAESLGLVDALVEVLNARPGLRVELAGFTDSSGEKAYNRELSRRRAEEILGTLVSKGIDPSRLKAKGYGEGLPAADNGTPEGRAMNRRVELRIPAASGEDPRP